jgi:DNA mismatch repair protein MSH5
MASRQSSVWFPDLPRSSAGRSSLAPSVRDRDDTPPLTQLSEEFDDSEDIIMAIDQKGKIGCCYYTYADCTLSFVEDISMPADEIIDVLKFQVKPTTLLIPSRLGDLEATTDEGRQYRVLVRPAGEFSYDAARKKLLAFQIGGDDGPGINMPGDLHDLSSDTGSRGRLFKLASWINIESRVTVGCAGAVLAYLQRKKAIEQGDGAGDRVEVAAIEMVSLKDIMFVNADTICSLQVFESEAHPSGYMAGAGKGGKEGLSLFGKWLR